MIAVSHPTGNQNVRQVLQALDEQGWLDSFHTTLGFHQDALILKTPLSKSSFGKRAYALPKKKLFSYPFKEFIRQLLKGRQHHPWLTHETGRFCIDAVYHDLDKRVAQSILNKRQNLTAIYAYEDGALASFKAAKSAGIKTLYELPIAYGRFAQDILKEEAERLPEWETTLVSTNDSNTKLQHKDEELALADCIICPSLFVKNSIPKDIAQKTPIHIIPYGCHSITHEDQRKDDGPLKVLFAGSMSQRKGLADAFTAFKQLNTQQAELHVLGSAVAPLEFYKHQYANFHYHPPRPNPEVLKLMQNCDVLLLPSLVEGRALVQLEALSCGLPLIITPNTGGDDLIEEKATGFIVPIRSPESIAEKINWLLENRSQLSSMRRACIAKAQATSWQHYREQLVDTLQIFLNSGRANQ